jgi:O-antigen/teichoic acid export membrane protein
VTTTTEAGTEVSASLPIPDPEADAASRSDLGTLARGGMLNLAGAISNGVLTFALVVVLTRGLGDAGYGAFVSAMGLFQILSNTSELGADTGLTRMTSRYLALKRPQDVRRTILAAVLPVLLVSSVFAVVLYVWAPELAEIFGRGAGSDRIADFARVFAPFLPLSATTLVLLAGTRGFGTMVPTVTVDKTARPAIQPLLALVAVAGGLGTTAVALSYAAPFAVSFAASATWLYTLLRRAERRSKRANGGRLPAARPTGDLAVRFWRFTAPRGGAGIFQVVTLWLNTLLLGRYGSTSAAGVFNAASRYVTAGLLVGVAIQQVAGPKLSELMARKSMDRAGTVYQATTAWLMVATWPLYLTFALFPTTLLSLFGRDFRGGHHALTILGLTMLLATAVGTVDVVLLMGGRSSWNFYNTVAGLVLNLALNLVLIPRYGVTGAALAWSASILTNNLAPLAQVWAFMHLHPFGRGFFRAALAAGVTYGGIGLAFRLGLGASVPSFLGYQVVAGVAYVALLWRFRQDLQLPVLWEELRRRNRRSASAPAPAPSV